MSSKIKAVTFDLWDTMIDDQSDEPKRRQRGLRSKEEERPYLVWEALNAGDPEAMGVEAGFDREHAARRIRELGSVCLWCDEFFTERAKRRDEDLAALPVMGERSAVVGS